MALWAGNSTTEQARIGAAIDGDLEAFVALAGLYLERVYRHAYYLLGERARAEDATQRALLQAWRTLGSLRESRTPFVVWLLALVHRYATVPDQSALASPDATPLAQGHRSNRSDEFLPGYAPASMHRAILRLAPEQRQVVALRFVERVGCAEVAAALGQSERSIQVVQHRALAELRRQLASEGKTHA